MAAGVTVRSITDELVLPCVHLLSTMDESRLGE